jgi:hypothetical protein
MGLFRRDPPAAGTLWFAEIDYGSGWLPYGPPLPHREAAEALARDLQRHGRAARVRQAEPEEHPEPDVAERASPTTPHTRKRKGPAKGYARRTRRH